MKKIITSLLCVVCIVSSVWIGASLFAKDVMQHSLLSIAVEEMHLEMKINEFLQTLPIPRKELFASQLSDIAKTIANNPKVNEEVNTYLDRVLEDIIYDNELSFTSHLNENIKKEIISYAPNLSALTNHLVAQEEITSVLTVALENVDFQSIYDTKIAEAKERISETEKLMIRMAIFLESETSLYASIVMTAMIAFIVFVLNLNRLSGLIYLGVIAAGSTLSLYTCQYLVPFIFNMFVSKGTPNQDVIKSASYFGNVAFYFLIVFVVCIVLKVIYQKLVIKRKQR